MALRSFVGGAVFAEVYGSSPPRVLALHGWGRRGSDFRRALDRFDVIAPDLPGFGATPVPDQVLGAQGYADLMSPILDEYDQPPLIVGHSFGGRVAVCLAASHPDRVGSLLLTGVPLLRQSPVSHPPLTYRIVRWMNGVGLVSDDRMERLRRKRGSADYRAATGVMRDILVRVVNEDYPEEMSAVTAPTRLIWGADDFDVPVQVARNALQFFSDADLEIVADTGHMLHLQRPDVLSKAVAEVLS